MSDIDIGQISEALNNKTDLDFNNMQPSNLSKETISGWGMPRTNTTLTLGASGATYTAPANGWVYVSRMSTATAQYIQIETEHLASKCISASESQFLAAFVPVKKNEEFTIAYNGDARTARFIYAEGDNT